MCTGKLNIKELQMIFVRCLSQRKYLLIGQGDEIDESGVVATKQDMHSH